jgi:hypothetical protein
MCSLAVLFTGVALACFVSMFVALLVGVRLAHKLTDAEDQCARLFEDYVEAQLLLTGDDERKGN